jgi:hypothetical protein
MTREALHFNSPLEYYPLAHIAKEAQEDLQDAFNTFDRNFYQQLVSERTKRQSYLNRSKIPIYYEGQLVYVKNQEPAPGSTILKLPYKGPFRVKAITPRNVVLVDLETGRDVTSHYEFLKPLSLKKFRLLLSKGWDLNLNNEKRTRTLGSSPILDSPLGLTDLSTVRSEESAIDNAPPKNSSSDSNNVSNSDSNNGSNNDSNSDSNSDSDNDSNNDESESIHEEIPYDDPRFDPMEGSSYNSIKYFEASLFDLAPTPTTRRPKNLETLPNLRPPPDPDPANGKLGPTNGKPARQSLHSLEEKRVEHTGAIGNTPDCTLLHTKYKQGPHYEASTNAKPGKKSGFKMVLDKMFKPRNPAKPT